MSTVHSGRKGRSRQGSAIQELLVVVALLAIAGAVLLPGVNRDTFIASAGWLFACIGLACIAGVYVAAQQYFDGRHRIVSLALGILTAAISYFVGTAASLAGVSVILGVALAGCVFLGVRSMRRAEQ